MSVRERGYQGTGDLLQVGQLVRRAYQKMQYWNSWSFARWDIWAQRRIGDEKVFGTTGWQQGIRLWEDERDGIVAAGVLHGRHQDEAIIVTDPDHRELEAAALGWVEACYTRHGQFDHPLFTEVTATNTFRRGLIESHRYTALPDYMTVRIKRLDGSGPEPVTLPPGYRIKSLETLDERRAFHAAVYVVFHFEDSIDVYRIVEQAPSSVPELCLLVMSDRNELCSFCTLWVDRALGIAEFEPVGTVPAFQKRGLASALLAEGCNRLRALGYTEVRVDSWSESPGANRLYDSAGLLPRNKLEGWRWDRPAV